MNYIIIDEIQNCIDFEKAISSLFTLKNVDLYLTISNAYLLSGELATHLSGRYVKIEVFPFSFKEYIQAEKETNIEESFSSFLKFGSFPYISLQEKKEEIIFPYLEGIYNTILIKDIARREKIKNIPLLERIVETLFSTIGSEISTNKITNTINSNGIKISNEVVDAYLNALLESFLFYEAKRYDIKGREILKTQSKFYSVDLGLRRLSIKSSSSEMGHLIENVVYLELKRRGYSVMIGKIKDKEVDFVAIKGNEKIYYQVALTVLDPNTLKGELSSLESIKDNERKILLTLDKIGDGNNYDGIRQYNIIPWLLGERN